MVPRTTGRLLLTALVGGLLVLGNTTPVRAVPAGAAPASTVRTALAARTRWTPEEGAKFNVPRADKTANMLRLEHQVIGAIRHARKNSLIRFAMFSFDRKPVADALIDAKRRGVSVQVLVNDHEVTHAQRMLRRRLGTNRHHKNWIYQCKNGCRSSGENLHSKFFLFSHTGGARNVVMTGSVNMKLNGAKNQYNDLWTINDREKLFSLFDTYFRQLKRDQVAKPTYWSEAVGRMKLFVTPYPNYNARRDPIMRILRKVKCHGARGHTGNHGRTVIHVVMHSWGEDRGEYIARRLRNLYGNGCDVKLLYGFAGARMRRELARPTRRGLVPIRSTGYDTNSDGELDLYTHQKNLTISGHYEDDRSTNIVVTGSSNWTVDGMHGDEMIFKINGMRAYPAYAADFRWLWNKRSHSVRWSPTTGANFEPVPTGGGDLLTRNRVARMSEFLEPGLQGWDPLDE